MGEQLELMIVTVPAAVGVCDAGILDVLDLGTIAERSEDDPPDDEDRLRRIRACEGVMFLLDAWSTNAQGPWDGEVPLPRRANVERRFVDVDDLQAWMDREPWALPQVKHRTIKAFTRRGMLSRVASPNA